MIQGIGLLFIMVERAIHRCAGKSGEASTFVDRSHLYANYRVLGETTLRYLLPANHAMLSASVSRFMLFDAGDLLLLLLAWIITRRLV